MNAGRHNFRGLIYGRHPLDNGSGLTFDAVRNLEPVLYRPTLAASFAPPFGGFHSQTDEFSDICETGWGLLGIALLYVVECLPSLLIRETRTFLKELPSGKIQRCDF
jgi:hypothetical protein